MMFPQLGPTAESVSKASSLVLRVGTDATSTMIPTTLTPPPHQSPGSTPRSSRLSSASSPSLPRAPISHFFPEKDSSDTNPLVQAWALHAMAGIWLPVVAPLVLAVSKCARDPSVCVGICAALALPKIYDCILEDPDRRFVANTVAAIGLCPQRMPTVAATCLEGLLALTSHGWVLSLMDGI